MLVQRLNPEFSLESQQFETQILARFSENYIKFKRYLDPGANMPRMQNSPFGFLRYKYHHGAHWSSYQYNLCPVKYYRKRNYSSCFFKISSLIRFL